MTCTQQESITIGQNLCPSLRGTVAQNVGGQLGGIEIRNLLIAADATSDAVYFISTVTNTVSNTVHLGSGSASGVVYVPPQKGSNATHTLDPFTIPPAGNNVVVHLADTSALNPNKYVFFDGPATFKVISVGDATHATLQFANFNGDLTPGSIIGAFVNLYLTAARTDLVYATAGAPHNFFSIDPDSLAVTNITALASPAGFQFCYFASVSNRVCVGGGGHLYSYSIATGTMASVDISGTNSNAGIVAYSSGQDLVYVLGGSITDPGNINKVTPYTPVLFTATGSDMACPNNVVPGTNDLFCPNNNSLYFSNATPSLAPFPRGLSVFNASTNGLIVNIDLGNGAGGTNDEPGAVVFHLSSSLVFLAVFGGVNVYNTSNVLICSVTGSNANRRTRSLYYSSGTGRVYAVSHDAIGGAIDYYA